MKPCLKALLLLATVFAAPVSADERILDFHADVVVAYDGSLTVTETIRVKAEGVNIRRGIYRDFPTDYHDRQGNRYRVGFSLIGIQRDGAEEDFHTEQRANGVRVYIGNAQRMLPPGEYEYRILYRTSRQLGFFRHYDELYWNVTGDSWTLPIDHASARITLPGPVPWQSVRSDFYTGAQGENGKAARFRISGAAEMEFATTAALAPSEGFTVALGWPKGVVDEPSLLERAGLFLRDNRAALVLLLGLLLPLGWYLHAWNRHGRDPRKGIIIPRFEPPKGLSAAACSYVDRMGMSSEAFTAAIISLAVKGYLRIDEKEGDYTLYRHKGPTIDSFTHGEATVLSVLLPENESWLQLDNENFREFRQARIMLNEALKSEYQGRLFKLNSIYMLPAVLSSIAAAAFAIPQPGGLLPWIIFVLASLLLHTVFFRLLQARTPLGRRVMDEIEGLRMYLTTAEQSRLQQMESPELTPQVFEMFLPFAFALGVENSWCDRFMSEFPDMVTEGTYRTGWYGSHRTGPGNLNHIGTRLNSSFSSAISSASTPPGSSSGSGGGGFSGGGGGGGGGGGW